ncbi:MAG: FtsX-like permease family protein [Candidatus Poribacteria bacterium]
MAVIGGPVAEELFPDSDPIGQEIRVKGVRFTVVGVMADRGKSIQYGFSWGDAIYIPLATAQQRLTGEEEIEAFHVHAVSTAKAPDAIDEVMRLMGRRHGDPDVFEAWAPGTRNLEFVTKMSSMLKGVLGCIAAFSLFVGGVGIMNIMLVSVTERTKEIGLRKAVGAHRRDIFRQFLIEAVVICLAGGILGIALGVGFAWTFARVISSPEIGGFIGPLLGFNEGWVTWPFNVSLPWSLVSMAVSVSVGLFFGLYPAVKAANLTPIEALRRV